MTGCGNHFEIVFFLIRGMGISLMECPPYTKVSHSIHQVRSNVFSIKASHFSHFVFSVFFIFHFDVCPWSPSRSRPSYCWSLCKVIEICDKILRLSLFPVTHTGHFFLCCVVCNFSFLIFVFLFFYLSLRVFPHFFN